MERQDSVQRFLELIRRSHRGKFKVYIGMSAGVGKTCRMLQEARQLLDAGVDVRIGYIETHGRAGTEALVEGLPLVPRRRLFYKGKELEETRRPSSTSAPRSSSWTNWPTPTSRGAKTPSGGRT